MSQRYLGGIITANPTAPTLASASGVWTLEQQFQNLSGVQQKIVGNSLRFRSSASAYLSRTLTTPTNNKIFTWSGWVKRGDLVNYPVVFGSGQTSGSTNYFIFYFNTTDGSIVVSDVIGGSQVCSLNTSSFYRDPSAWYHIVYSVDTTQATSSNRAKLYVNGVQVTSFATSTYYSLNSASSLNVSGYVMSTGAQYINGSASNYFDGYLTEVNFIDGQALTPSSFGAYDSTGVWQPMAYAGTYGTNGFYLNFSDTSAATAAAIGKDYSGNGNNWTPNNISVTAGATYDAMIDSPTNYATGTAYGLGNYSVINPLTSLSGQTSISAANLQLLGTSTLNSGNDYGTIGVTSGKWYWENTVLAISGASSYPNFGAVRVLYGPSSGKYIGDTFTGGVGIFTSGGIYKEGSLVTAPTSYTTNDVIGIALDVDNLTCAFYKNGTLIYTVTGLTAGTYWAGVGSYYNSSTACNFGQRPYAYTPPTGFKALNTANLPTVTINNGAQYMAASTYTGTGATLSIVNSGNNTIGTTFAPDFVWIKDRSAARSHRLFDTVRGPTKALFSDATDAETTLATDLTAFNSNGFTLGVGLGSNASTETYVGWQWKAAGSTVSNTSGTITSTVNANTSAGFSIVSFVNASGTNQATVGHGLGVAPKLIISKNRDTNANNWAVFHASVCDTTSKFLKLNTTDALSTYSTVWGAALPTSSVFGVTGNGIAASSVNVIAYCFTDVAGYSKFGSYTGNGSTDGPFVYLGFRPRYVLMKNTSTATNWTVFDSARDPENVADLKLLPNASDAESTEVVIDFTANGFKIRVANTGNNGSGNTIIYAAFAENPFNTARAR